MSLRWIINRATLGFIGVNGRVVLVDRAFGSLMIGRFKRCIRHSSSSGLHPSTVIVVLAPRSRIRTSCPPAEESPPPE